MFDDRGGFGIGVVVGGEFDGDLAGGAVGELLGVGFGGGDRAPRLVFFSLGGG